MPFGIKRKPVKPFEIRYANKRAAAISDTDIDKAAAEIGVSPAHIRMIMKVESNGKSFDSRGRPIILFEPRVFHKRTRGKWSPSEFSYAAWGAKPYPSKADDRWRQMSNAAHYNERAAIESASWGLFQIMGFHWKTLGFQSAYAFAEFMAASEANHLDAVVRFIRANGMAGALGRCKAGDPASCREFARRYNGPGYERNHYHVKMARALQ